MNGDIIEQKKSRRFCFSQMKLRLVKVSFATVIWLTKCSLYILFQLVANITSI